MGGAELPASGLDVSPLALAGNGRDVFCPQLFFKSEHLFRCRGCVRRAWGIVIGDEVELGFKPGADFRQFPYLCVSVVYSVHD